MVVGGLIHILDDGTGRRFERERAIDNILLYCFKEKFLSAK